MKWVFVRRHLPVEITAEFETWRKVRDSSGAEGWVHRAMLISRRNVVVVDKQTTLRRRPKDDSPAIARLNPGMVARVEECSAIWCNVTIQGYDGWLRRAGVWGLYPNESPKLTSPLCSTGTVRLLSTPVPPLLGQPDPCGRGLETVAPRAPSSRQRIAPACCRPSSK